MTVTERRSLNTHSAAAYLGVSIGTVRRWTDIGALPCLRTPGGHRRFLVAELDKFIADMQSDKWGWGSDDTEA